MLVQNGSSLNCDGTIRENCEKCGTGGSSTHCVLCSYGYFFAQNNCNQCLNGCTYCTEATQCAKCKIGFYKYEAEMNRGNGPEVFSTCIICSDNCLKCNDGLSCEASNCAPGYFLTTKGCPMVTQPKNMNGRTGDVEATSCCTLCQSNCYECEGENSCGKCKSGYFLNANALDESIKECVICSDYEIGIVGCLECEDGTKCSKCKSDYYLKNETFCAEVVEYCEGAKPVDPSLSIVTYSSGRVFAHLVGLLGIVWGIGK